MSVELDNINRRSAVRGVRTAGAGLLFRSAFPSVAEAAPDGDDYTIHSDAHLVLLDVSVTDARGLPVAGLEKNNFAVWEEGKPRKITVFAKDDAPVTVGILVDESQSMRLKRADVLVAAQTLIEESNPADEIFVLNFNDTVKRGLPARKLFSDNIGELREALDRGIPRGMTALNDAIADGLDQLDMGKRTRKALMVISDGGDNASGHKRAEVFDMIERRIATLYAVGLYDPDSKDKAPGFLRRLADVSGGRAYFPSKTSEMIPVCRAIAKDIRARYTIGYVPDTAANGKNAMRHIVIRASAPGHIRLNARTRTSYRYDHQAQ
jgi:Ca-activated chloride channel homolog